ncbi:hypothetical protein QQM79_19730 [Marinobacteraceae bacterium S3BR75-40.1]
MTPETALKIIQQAKRQEAHKGRFHDQMAQKLPQLHVIIGIHDDDPVACLVRFVVEYVEMAPRLIEFVEACAREAGKETLFAPFIEAANGYFTRPSALLIRYDGLDGLLIKAYLCHRLMEEMYENNRSIRNSHLVDIEATQANLLAHHLIGEPFANELDQSILITVRQIAGTPDYYELNLDPFVEQARNAAWDWMREYWQNLLSRNHIQFHFSHRQTF